MRNVTGLAMAGLSMISSTSSFLTDQQSTNFLISMIADALRYFSPHQSIDVVK